MFIAIKRRCKKCGVAVSELPFVCRNELCKNYGQRVDAEFSIASEVTASELSSSQFTTALWFRALGVMAVGCSLVAVCSLPWAIGLPVSLLLAVYSIWRGILTTVRDCLIVGYVIFLIVLILVALYLS